MLFVEASSLRSQQTLEGDSKPPETTTVSAAKRVIGFADVSLTDEYSSFIATCTNLPTSATSKKSENQHFKSTTSSPDNKFTKKRVAGRKGILYPKISTVAVDAEYRRQGVGTLLLAGCAKQVGAATVNRRME
jgi:ribosomal protein S18 acetylase RimI-like enzyme